MCIKYIACEDLNFLWSYAEVQTFDRMWQEGKTLIELSEYFNKTQEEVLLLAVDRAIKGAIESRKGGIFGNG